MEQRRAQESSIADVTTSSSAPTDRLNQQSSEEHFNVSSKQKRVLIWSSRVHAFVRSGEGNPNRVVTWSPCVIDNDRAKTKARPPSRSESVSGVLRRRRRESALERRGLLDAEMRDVKMRVEKFCGPVDEEEGEDEEEDKEDDKEEDKEEDKQEAEEEAEEEDEELAEEEAMEEDKEEGEPVTRKTCSVFGTRLAGGIKHHLESFRGNVENQQESGDSFDCDAYIREVIRCKEEGAQVDVVPEVLSKRKIAAILQSAIITDIEGDEEDYQEEDAEDFMKILYKSLLGASARDDLRDAVVGGVSHARNLVLGYSFFENEPKSHRSASTTS